jgi:hypothetical protein
MFIAINSVGDFLRKLHGLKAFVHYFTQKMFRAIPAKRTDEKQTPKFLKRTIRVRPKQNIPVLTPVH